MVRLAYSHADLVAFYYIDDYFDISSEQEDKLEPDLSKYLKWAKATIRPELTALLERLHEDVKDGLAREELAAFYAGLDKIRRDATTRALPLAVDFLENLTLKQIEYFTEQLEEANKKHERRIASDDEDYAEHMEDRREHLFEAYEEKLGQLTEEQKKIISASVISDRDHDKHRLMMRRETQSLLITTVKSGYAPTIKSYLERLARDPTEGRSDEYRRYFNSWRTRNDELYLALDKTLSPRQRAHLLDKMKEWIDLLNSLES